MWRRDRPWPWFVFGRIWTFHPVWGIETDPAMVNTVDVFLAPC